jgi:hypothetical protein
LVDQGLTRVEYKVPVLGLLSAWQVRNSSDLYKLLDKCVVGDSLDLEVLRGNAKEHVTAVLEANA